MTPEWLIRVLRRVGIGRPSFAPGQVWRYATRAGEEHSRVHILRVETFPKIGDVVHIAITNVFDAANTISHVPVSAEALERSGLSFEARSGSPPDWEEGYAIWREEFDAGNAGVFSIPVAEIVDVMEQALRHGTPA